MGGPHRAGTSERPLIVRGAVEFAPWHGAWGRLAAAAGADDPWHQSEWLEAAWTYPGKPMVLALLARTDGELSAGVALCRRWESGGLVRAPVRGVHNLPHLPYLYPTCSVAAARPELAPDAAVRLAESGFGCLSWDALLVSHCDDRSRWYENAVQAVARARGWQVRECDWSSEAVLDFDDGPDAYWDTRSGHMRRKLNAGERGLAAQGEVRFRDLAADGLPWTECWAALEDIYRRSWQKGAGLSPFDPPWGDLNRTGLEPFHRRGQLLPLVLTLAGRPIAFDLWLAGGTSLYGLARGMDPAYRDDSAGGVLARRSLEYAHARGFRREFLGPVNDQPHFAYKQRWLTRTGDPRMLIVSRPRSWYGALEGAFARDSALARLWTRHRLGERLRDGFARVRRWRRR
jgi:hypothetical protein